MLESTQINPLNQRIADRLRKLRAERGLSLEALATRCGVSRSALSLIERAESSPTAVLLNKLATGLGVTLSSLLEEQHPAELDGMKLAPASPVARLAEQFIWQDPVSGYLRRSVSPAGVASPMQIVEVQFPAGQRVAFENAPGALAQHQQIWMLAGEMDFGIGDETHRLSAGDCLAFTLDRPTFFFNPGQQTARYAVVIVAETAIRK
ncbi:XRE family transcriptional regulator [Paucibacter sp. AS339]|uniref:helix-turn-helix domain-containing protein n=1 Tax=Paucibacter hankyongi TaxID=3133434 RepID=UPI0030A97D81